ncbi:MAG: SMC-Scp complex subunit ScpB [Planctomycetota bacterium]|nr:SMC-Scp complex subunit ScpB [Planctomycetota bacterium]
MSIPEASAEAPEVPVTSPEATAAPASESSRKTGDSDPVPAAGEPGERAETAELPQGAPAAPGEGLDAPEAPGAVLDPTEAEGGSGDESSDEPQAHGQDRPEAASPDGSEGQQASNAGSLEAADGEAAEVEEELPPLTDEARAALGQALFALLFASPDPLSLGRLKDLTESPTAHVREGLTAVEQLVEASGLPLVLKAIAGGYRLFSAPEVAEVVARLAKARKAEQVTPAALETLSIVAYRQPTTKAEVEAIRGVQAGPMLRQLIDRGLVKVAGRADQPGSPLLYATTKEFLDRFGLAKLKDLPRDAELK